MIDLVALLQAAQDGDGILHGGFGHHNRLKAALQRGVLFDILTVLVQRGRADAVQLAPGQHGLEQVARVHGALGLTGAHDGVQLVDKEDDAAFRFFDFVQNGLQALLELAPVLGTGYQTAHVQREDGFIFQTGGHVALDDTLCQTLGDGGFAHAGLADEHRVVFALAGQDADDIADLVIAADDRIQLVGAGALHQIGAVFFQRVVGLLRIVRGDPLVAAHLGQSLQQAFFGHAVGLQQRLQRTVGGLHQRQQQMLHRDIFVLHGGCGLLGGAQGLVKVG